MSSTCRGSGQQYSRGTRVGPPAAEHGITPGGYRVLDSLRMEKGYRYWGTDLTSSDTPYQSGLGFCVALEKGEFNGRSALSLVWRRPAGSAATHPDRRRRGVRDDLRRGGGQKRWERGRARARSCGYGYTVRRNVARWLRSPAELEQGTELTVDVFDAAVPARIERDVLDDPDGERIRG